MQSKRDRRMPGANPHAAYLGRRGGIVTGPTKSRSAQLRAQWATKWAHRRKPESTAKAA